MARRATHLAAVALATLLCTPAHLSAGPRDLVVVRPGGPTPSEEANLQVTRLITEIGSRAGWEPGSASADYFNDASEALAHIAADPPGFLLATPGFFLAHRQELALRPITQILLDGEATHRYFVVALADGVAELSALAGGTLLGSPLAEPAFVERVVLRNRLAFGVGVEAGYARALSALRRLSRGDVQAVILDATEHAGLGSLPFAADLVTIFTSEPIPNTGVFALDGIASQADARALATATRDFCAQGEGADICTTYGISGFRPAPDGVFDAIIRQYEGPGSP